MSVNIKTKHEREALRNYIKENIITSKEAVDILGFSRARLNQLVQNGIIIPVQNGVYLKDDIIAYNETREV